MLHYLEISDLNAAAADPAGFIRRSEAEYDLLIQNAARAILKAGEERPIVLLSGPSGSGKTTSALRIEALLGQMGHPCHTLSMDNYYYRDKNLVVPLDDGGQPDLESPVIIDQALLQEHLRQILRGETIEVPRFDFVAQRRLDERRPLTRRPGEVVVVEGIHALNPQVVGDIHAWGVGIYISVRTRVRDAGGHVLHPEKVRLLRRLIRDRRGRGQSYAETVRRFASVGRGERLYILPNKHHADIALDTFCPYELGIYRGLLLDDLEAMDEKLLAGCDLADLVPILRQVAPVPADGIEPRALIREFIGGGLAE